MNFIYGYASMHQTTHTQKTNTQHNCQHTHATNQILSGDHRLPEGRLIGLAAQLSQTSRLATAKTGHV
jgi:hypothetical protein